jgi:hypothetical protein
MVNELAQELDPLDKEEEGQEVEKEATEQPKEEPKEAVEGEAKEEEQKPPEKPPKGFVPQGALHEERARRKAAIEESTRIRAENEQYRQVMEQRFAQIQTALQQHSQPKAPSFEDDPVNALKHGVETTQQQLEQIRAYQQHEWQRQQDMAAQQQVKSRLESAVADDVREFMETAPDYLDAYKDLKEKRFKQYTALGYPPEQSWQIVNQEEYQLAATAFQNGRSPAQAVYEMALAYGYTKKEAKQASDNVQKMETLQKGVKAASSLGSGGTPTGKLTVDSIAQMNDDEFDTFMKSGGWSKLG